MALIRFCIFDYISYRFMFGNLCAKLPKDGWKRNAGRDCKCLSIGAPFKLLEHSYQCSIVKDCNKTHRNFCFCIIFAKFAHSTPNFIQNDLKQWTIRIITA